MSLEASADNASITIAASADVESSGGAHTYTADDLVLTGTVTATGQAVTLQSKTASDAIELGNAASGTADTLELTSTELSAVTAGSIIVGSGSAGAITISGDVTPGGTSVLSLITGGAITGTAGGIIETDLALTAGGTINFTDASTDVDKLAVSDAGQTVTFTDLDGIAIDTVSGVAGVTASEFNLVAAGAVTQAQAIAATGLSVVTTGTGPVTLTNSSNALTTVSLDVNSGNIAYTDSDGFAVGTVNSIPGIDTDASNRGFPSFFI